MEYKYAKDRQNFEDFASGRVLYYGHGQTSFPVRLASEIFQRAEVYLERFGKQAPFVVYDPCCGGAYLLTVIGYLHGKRIAKILASDINDKVLRLATSNLSLLDIEGLHARVRQIESYMSLYGKQSHKSALDSAARLHRLLLDSKTPIETMCFQYDILSERWDVDRDISGVDLVITDVPYGLNVDWVGLNEGIEPVQRLLNNLMPVLHEHSVVAVIANKSQKLRHDQYVRLEYARVGKRHFALFTPRKTDVKDGENTCCQ